MYKIGTLLKAKSGGLQIEITEDKDTGENQGRFTCKLIKEGKALRTLESVQEGYNSVDDEYCVYMKKDDSSYGGTPFTRILNEGWHLSEFKRFFNIIPKRRLKFKDLLK